MAESLGSAVLDLTADDSRFNATVDGAQRKVSGLGDTFKRVGKSMSGFGDKLSTRVTLPILAVAAAAFKLASDAEESSNKFDIVMGRAADSVRASLKDLEKSIPLTTGELLTLAAGVQDLLVPMGLSRDVGAEMSTTFLELAGDIAAFNDVSPAQVLADIKSGLIGSSEPLFKYGVDTRVAALETVALANGLILQGEKLTDVTRAQAVLIQIQQQSSDAMGAAAREMEGASAASRFLFRDVKQLGEEIGKTLLPIITPMIQKVREWIQWFTDLSPATQKIIVKTALLVAAVGPLLSIFGRLTSGVGALMNVFKLASGAGGLPAMAGGFSKLIPILTGPVGIVLAIAAVALALSSFISKEGGMLENWIARTTESLGDIRDSLTDNIPAVNDLADTFRKQFPAITREISKGVTAGDSYANILNTLKGKFAEGTDAGDALRVKLDELEAAERAAALAAEKFLNPAIVDTGNKAGDTEKKLAALEEIVGKLGFVTAKNATAELDNLTKAFESGLIPQEQMVQKVADLTAKYSELGLLSPAVQAELAAITLKLIEQGAEIDSKTLVSLGRYKLALEQIEATRMKEWQDGWSDALVDSTGAMTDLGTATDDFMFELPIKVSEVTDTFTNMFGELKTGIPLFDDLLRGATNFISGLLSGLPLIGDLFGSIFGEGGNVASFVQQLFGGGSGSIGGIIGSALGGPLGSIVGNFATKLAGMLFGAIGGALRKLFGGPSEAELAGRDAAAAFRNQLTGLLGPQQLAEAGTDEWKKSVIALRDTFLAFGRTEAEALAFSERLWAAEAQGPEAVAALIAEIGPMMDQVQAAMAATGLSLTDLRNLAINNAISMGISVTEAFQLILSGINEVADVSKNVWREWAEDAGVSFETFESKSKKELRAIVAAMGLSAKQSKRIFKAMLAKQEGDQKAFNKTQRDKFREQADDLGLSEKDKAAFVKANMKLRRQTLNAADKEAKQIARDLEKAFNKNQREMAKAAEEAANRAGKAWAKSAQDAVDAWASARQQTVGGSSITDISRIGSEAAAKLGKSHHIAAVDTGIVWKEQGANVERILKSIADSGGASTSGQTKKKTLIEKRVQAFGQQRRTGGSGIDNEVVQAMPSSVIRGGGLMSINLNLDGEIITRQVIKMTPEILRKLGLQ